VSKRADISVEKSEEKRRESGPMAESIICRTPEYFDDLRTETNAHHEERIS
jgi:hypothetical protein